MLFDIIQIFATFLLIPLLRFLLRSSWNSTWNYLDWNPWNNMFQLKAVFLSTLHFVSVNSQLSCFSTNSSIIFLFLFKDEILAILILKNKNKHNTFLSFKQNKLHLQKTKLYHVIFWYTLFFLVKCEDEVMRRFFLSH